MRVLLINPPYPFEEFPQPPLGLAYLAAALIMPDALQKHGVGDLSFDPWEPPTAEDWPPTAPRWSGGQPRPGMTRR